ncbi:hypothetical protein Tco_0332068, partial [Tanacetum coccineum]
DNGSAAATSMDEARAHIASSSDEFANSMDEARARIAFFRTNVKCALVFQADFVVNDADMCGTSSAHYWNTCTLVHMTRRVNIAGPTSGMKSV